jgi:hypothetical protein
MVENTKIKQIDEMSNSELKQLVNELYKENKNLKKKLNKYLFSEFSGETDQEYQDGSDDNESHSNDYKQNNEINETKKNNNNLKDKINFSVHKENKTNTDYDAEYPYHTKMSNQNSDQLLSNKKTRRPLSNRGKNSRINFPIDFKYKTLKVYEGIKNKDATARVMGISLGTIDVWIKKKTEIYDEYLKMKELLCNKNGNHLK